MPNRIRLEPWTESNGRIELAATLDVAGKQDRLWWRVPAQWKDSLTTWADSFVIGFMFPMMQAAQLGVTEIEVEGPVSPSLLANLESFNDVWHMWVPSRYPRRIRIGSKDEVEPPMPSEPDGFVLPYSSGVDSSFTAFWHARKLAGRNTKRVAAGITMFGFDILSTESNVPQRYAELRDGAREMLESLGLAHIEIDSNFRTMNQLWRQSHATHLASGLALFGRSYAGGLIPNSVPMTQLGTLLGSHPLSDPMLSSDRFRIIDDAGALMRWEKIEMMLGWPEAMKNLRVCFGAAGNVGNCGVCEKCLRSAIAFKIVDATPTNGLPTEITPKMFRRILLKPDTSIGYWRDLLVGIEMRGKQREPWAAGVRSTLRRAMRLRMSKRLKQPFLPLRAKVRAIFRGADVSKRQQVEQRDASSNRS